PRHVGRDHAGALSHQSGGHDHPHGHARSGDGGQDAQARDRARYRPASPRRATRGVHDRVKLRLVTAEAVRSLAARMSTTVAATLTVLIGMFVLGLTIALGTWVLSWSNHVKKQLEVKVYFANTATKVQEEKVANQLSNDTRVDHSTFCSSACALKQMRKKFPD